jgi:hypothetical protein
MADELATVATFSTASEADAAKLALEGEGIRALLTDMDWTALGVSAANIKLQVAPEDVEQATELLAQHGHTVTGEQPDDDNAPDQITCLNCGKVIPEGESKCPACGWTYVT